MTSEATDSSKIPTHGVALVLDGSILEITRDAPSMFEYRTVDLSKYRIELNGLDQEGYLRLRLIPREPMRLRNVEKKKSMITSEKVSEEIEIDGEVITPTKPKYKTKRAGTIPLGFSLYSERETEQGAKHRVFKNQDKSFILRMETKRGSRQYTLGDLHDHASYISRLAKLLEDAGTALSFSEIHKRAYKNHMSDTNKLRACLEVLHREHIVVRYANKYAHATVPLQNNVNVIEKY